MSSTSLPGTSSIHDPPLPDLQHTKLSRSLSMSDLSDVLANDFLGTLITSWGTNSLSATTLGRTLSPWQSSPATGAFRALKLLVLQQGVQIRRLEEDVIAMTQENSNLKQRLCNVMDQNVILINKHDVFRRENIALKRKNATMKQQDVDLKHENMVLRSGVKENESELSRLRAEYYGELTQAKVRIRMSREDRDKIKVLEDKMDQREKFIWAVIDGKIHYPVMCAAYEAIQDGREAEEALIDAIMQASSREASPWSKIIPAVVGPRSPEQYLSAISLVAKVRGDLYESKKVLNFWKTLAKCDPANESTITPSSSLMSDIGEEVFAVADCSAEPIVFDDVIAMLRKGQTPYRTLIPSDERAAAAPDIALPAIVTPLEFELNSPVIVHELVPPSTLLLSIVASSEPESSRAEPSIDSLPLLAISETLPPIKPSKGDTAVAPPEVATSSIPIKPITRTSITPPRLVHSASPPTKSRLPTPRVVVTPAKQVKVAVSPPKPKTLPPTAKSTLKPSQKTTFTPIRSRLSTPQRIGTVRPPLIGLDTNRPVTKSGVSKLRTTKISNANNPTAHSVVGKKSLKASAKELGKRCGVILEYTIPSNGAEIPTQASTLLVVETESPDLTLLYESNSCSVQVTDKVSQARGIAVKFDENPTSSSKPYNSVNSRDYDTGRPEWVLGDTLVPPANLDMGAIDAVEQDIVVSENSEARPSLEPGVLSSPEAGQPQEDDDDGSLMAAQALESLERICAAFSSSSLGSLEMTDEDAYDSDSDLEALIRANQEDPDSPPTSLSELPHIRKALEEFEESMKPPTPAVEGDQEFTPAPQSTTPTVKTVTWAASIRRRRTASSSTSSASSSSSSSLDSPSNYIKRVSTIPASASCLPTSPTSTLPRRPAVKTMKPSPSSLPATQATASKRFSTISSERQKPPIQSSKRGIPTQSQTNNTTMKALVTLTPMRPSLGSLRARRTNDPPPPQTPPSKVKIMTIAHRHTSISKPQITIPTFEIPEPSYGEISPPEPMMKPRAHTINTISPLPPTQCTPRPETLSPLTSPMKPRSNTFNTFSPTTRSPLSQHVVTNSLEGSSPRGSDSSPPAYPLGRIVPYRGIPQPRYDSNSRPMKGRSMPRDSMPPPPTAAFMRPMNHSTFIPIRKSLNSAATPLIPDCTPPSSGGSGLSTAQYRTLFKRGLNMVVR